MDGPAGSYRENCQLPVFPVSNRPVVPGPRIAGRPLASGAAPGSRLASAASGSCSGSTTTRMGTLTSGAGGPAPGIPDSLDRFVELDLALVDVDVACSEKFGDVKRGHRRPVQCALLAGLRWMDTVSLTISEATSDAASLSRRSRLAPASFSTSTALMLPGVAMTASFLGMR